MAKRVKVTGTQLSNWDEVDDAVKRMALLMLQRAEFDAELHRTVTAAKEMAAIEVAPLDKEMEQLQRAVKEYVDAHRPDLEPLRSKVLNFGAVGYRRSTSLSIGDPDFTLARLKEQERFDCIRVKTEVDREALRQYDDEILMDLGVARKNRDTFFLEPDIEKVKAL